MINYTLTIRGLQQAQDRILRAHAAMQPSGAAGQAVQVGTAEAHRYATSITHVDTGTLRIAHRPEVDKSRLRGTVSIDPSAVNPRTGERAADYGPIEHARGGSHAFYRRTATERGQKIAQDMADVIRRGGWQ